MDIKEIGENVERLRDSFFEGVSLPLSWRLKQLQNLKKMMIENKDAILAAHCADFQVLSTFQGTVTEYNLVTAEIALALKHLSQWTTEKSVHMPLAVFPATGCVRRMPKGVICIMAPWNYPVNLALVPLVGSIAGGNCTFLKVSRHSANVAKLLVDLLPKYMDPRCFCVEGFGGRETISALLSVKWDHIFFTGSVAVGKLVAAAAAKHLTSTSLELGGRNPCIITKHCDLQLTAKRVVWGKNFNSGQTCVAVNHVIVVGDVAFRDAFIEETKKAYASQYGSDPRRHEGMIHIINEYNTKRLQALAKSSGTVAFGDPDEASVKDKYMPFVILKDVTWQDPVMQEEIFGPIMPILLMDSLPAVLRELHQLPSPLSAYLFSDDPQEQELMTWHSRSGQLCFNDSIIQFLCENLPFGGVGESGSDVYHGAATFEAFTQIRSIVSQSPKWYLDTPFRYPRPSKDAVEVLKAPVVNVLTKGF